MKAVMEVGEQAWIENVERERDQKARAILRHMLEKTPNMDIDAAFAAAWAATDLSEAKEPTPVALPTPRATAAPAPHPAISPEMQQQQQAMTGPYEIIHPAVPKAPVALASLAEKPPHPASEGGGKAREFREFQKAEVARLKAAGVTEGRRQLVSEAWRKLQRQGPKRNAAPNSATGVKRGRKKVEEKEEEARASEKGFGSEEEGTEEKGSGKVAGSEGEKIKIARGRTAPAIKEAAGPSKPRGRPPKKVAGGGQGRKGATADATADEELAVTQRMALHNHGRLTAPAAAASEGSQQGG